MNESQRLYTSWKKSVYKGAAQGNFLGAKEVFCILIVVMVTQLYIGLKIQGRKERREGGKETISTHTYAHTLTITWEVTQVFHLAKLLGHLKWVSFTVCKLQQS